MRTAWPTCLIAALLLAGCTSDHRDLPGGSPAAPEAPRAPSEAPATAGASRPAPAESSEAAIAGPETAETAPIPSPRFAVEGRGRPRTPEASATAQTPSPIMTAQADVTDDAADRLPTAGPDEPDESDALPQADWFRDPTCRHEHRWWSGSEWTAAVSDDGAEGEHALTDDGQLAPPDPSWPVDPCVEAGIMLTRFPFTAEELGCTGSDPACVLEEGELPRATRLVSYQELVDSGGYDRRLLHDLAPEGLSDDVVLGYLTECLVDWPLFPHERLGYEGTPVQTCSMVWRYMAYPITYLGARDDLRCVWEAYKSYYLRGEGRVARYILTGWAERCASWLDPQPHRAIPDDCQLPDGYHSRLSADDRFAEYGLSFDDPDLTAGAVRLRWCSLLARCEDLWRQVAPTRSAYFTRGLEQPVLRAGVGP